MVNKVAVILSGCGVYDGSEVNEAVLTLLALEEEGLSYECFAPDKDQLQVINHKDGSISETSRNVLDESARISRGIIYDLNGLKTEEFSALVVPGGFGAAKNLCDFATQGANFNVDPSLVRVCHEFNTEGKPLGFMCIAPVILAKVFGNGIRITIGDDVDTVSIIESLGAYHVKSEVDTIVYDETFNVVTTPAYMLASNVLEANKGIRKLVAKIASLVR